MGAVGTGGRVGVRRLEYRWLLPGLLTQEIATGGGDAGPAPRSARDWAVDVVLFAGAVYGGLAESLRLFDQIPNVPPGLRVADLAAGLITCAALWWRRRWPAALTLAVTPFGVFSVSCAFGALALMFSVAVHRRPQVATVVAAVFCLPAFFYPLVWPDPDFTYAGSVLLSLGLTAGVTGWGMFVRARRQLVISWRERAALAEAERHRQVADARRAERLRIAREMHDVLGHRLSLLTMHAGALEFRPDAPADQLARSAGAVGASARQALAELRQVVGLLRQDDDPAAAPAVEAVPAVAAEPTRQVDRAPRPDAAPAAVPAPDAALVALTASDAAPPTPAAVPGLAAAPEPAAAAAPAAPAAPVPAAPPALAPAAPGMPDLAALVGESRRAGVAVRAHYRLVEPHTLWPEAGRGAYRIVQEALTNARKHAPGQPVTVTVDGSAARGLRIEIRNPMPVPGVGETSGRAGPTGGTGLVGLIERAALAGGALRHERTTDGEFCVTAWLPWAPGDGSRPSRVRRCEAPVSGLARTGVSGG